MNLNGFFHQRLSALRCNNRCRLSSSSAVMNTIIGINASTRRRAYAPANTTERSCSHVQGELGCLLCLLSFQSCPLGCNFGIIAHFLHFRNQRARCRSFLLKAVSCGFTHDVVVSSCQKTNNAGNELINSALRLWPCPVCNIAMLLVSRRQLLPRITNVANCHTLCCHFTQHETQIQYLLMFDWFHNKFLL